jgi:hypothetical protein
LDSGLVWFNLIYVYIYVYKYEYTCVCVFYIYTNIYLYIHTHIYTHIYIHVYIYIFIYVFIFGELRCIDTTCMDYLLGEEGRGMAENKAEETLRRETASC